MSLRRKVLGREEGAKAADFLQAEDERGPQDDLCKFDSGSSDRCAGKGIHIIDGNKSVKTAHRADINEGISTSFGQG